MLATKRLKFNRLYYFKAWLIHIPISFNRMGIDPLPRYFVEPQELEQVLKYSLNPSSIANGYKLDEETGFYVKNIDTIDETDLEDQFSWMQMNPPFWFFNEASYEEFLAQNFDQGRSNLLQGKFNMLSDERVFVDSHEGSEDVNDPLPAHYYVEYSEWLARGFAHDEVVEWPKEKNILIFDDEKETVDDFLEGTTQL
tara:strand:- start:763 stop:1353 length:591 start_codon:yes stop_codon:yes gene_type:complete